MAGTLLHITLAHKALEAASLPDKTKNEISNHIHDFRLGSVVIDLPYYDRLWLTGLRAVAGMEIRYADWGIRMHKKSPVSLALSLLDTASNAGERAIALGFLTHVAVDVVFHTEIERRVEAELSGKLGKDKLHKLIEDQMDLLIHKHLLGHTGMGTSYARKMFLLLPILSWADYFTSALFRAHQTTHSPARLRRCLRALGVFGITYSGPFPWVKTKVKENQELVKTAIRLANEAIALSAHHMEAGAAYLSGEIDRDEFRKRIPDRSLADGGDLSS